MDYTLASLRHRVLVDKLDDDEFDSQIVDNFINDTQRDIFTQYELPFQEKIFSGTIPAGSTMFKMPNDVSLVQSHSVVGVPGFANGRMRFKDFFAQYPDAVNAPAQPISAWTLYGGNMLTSAPTDKDYTMMLFYIKSPTTLRADTDVPEIPEEFAELLVLGAFLRIQKRNEDFDLAQYTEADYARKLGELVDRYGMRTTGPIKMKNQQIRG